MLHINSIKLFMLYRRQEAVRCLKYRNEPKDQWEDEKKTGIIVCNSIDKDEQAHCSKLFYFHARLDKILKVANLIFYFYFYKTNTLIAMHEDRVWFLSQF